MRILALDQSAHTGWCHGAPGEKPISGTFRLRDDQLSDRALRLEAFLIETIIANQIQVIYFEEPIIPQGNKRGADGEPQRVATSLKTLLPLIGYAFVIGMTARRRGIQAYPLAMQTWRSEFGVPTQAPRKIKGTIDRRKWVKDQTIARCQRLGFEPADDNAADAIGLWWVACQRRTARLNAPTFDIFSDARI